MQVVILGCGRTGSYLARMLEENHKVTIIEEDYTWVKRYGSNIKSTIIIGDAQDEDILEQASIHQADAFLALTRNDNTNIMVAQIASRIYNVPRVCIRLTDPNRCEEYRKMGYFCINPNGIMAQYMNDWLLENPFGSINEYNKLFAGMEI